MKRTFRVEIRQTCKVCEQAIISNRFRTYCSKKCRNKFFNKKYAPLQARLQRDRQDRAHSVPGPGKIKCWVCGRYYVQVCSHAYLRHGISAREFKKLNGVDVKKGFIPVWYKDKKAESVYQNWEAVNLNLLKGIKYWFKPGDPRAGRYERSQ